jgi:hypothetical protein
LSNTERVFGGLDLRPRDPSPLATGSASVAPEARERADHVRLNGEAKPQQLAPEVKRAALGEEIATLLAEHDAEGATIKRISSKDIEREAAVGCRRQHDTAMSKRNGSRISRE